jgi:tetratricopeptide (TPR) repeat protein
MIGTTVLLILVLPSGGFFIRAQQQRVQIPSPENAEVPHKYVPPSASHSVEIGDFYLKRKNFNAALSRYQEAVKTDPHYAPAYQGLGMVYEKTGHRRQALEAYQRYLDELPSAQEAREAKRVHKSIARLQKQLSQGGKS